MYGDRLSLFPRGIAGSDSHRLRRPVHRFFFDYGLAICRRLFGFLIAQDTLPLLANALA
jgi:hypothetical protein